MASSKITKNNDDYPHKQRVIKCTAAGNDVINKML